jgi:DNA-binding NarL/FixJ family response regulator
MINVAFISLDANDDLAFLSQKSGIKAIGIIPTNLKRLIDELTLFSANIIAIEHAPDNMTIDRLCHYLGRQFQDARCIILTSKKPNFEMLQNSGFKVRGYVSDEQRKQLDKVVRVVHDGEAWLPRKLVTEMLNRLTSNFFMTDLSETASKK